MQSKPGGPIVREEERSLKKSASSSSGWSILSAVVGIRNFLKYNGITSFSDERTQKEIAVLMLAMGVFSFLPNPTRGLGMNYHAGFKPKIQDHPFVAYLIENVTAVALVSLALKTFPAGTLENEFQEEVETKVANSGGFEMTLKETKPKAIWRVFLVRYLHSVGRMCFLSDLGHQVIKVYCEKLYKHRPFFSNDAPPPNHGELLRKEYFGTNFPMYVVFAIIEAAFADVANWMFNQPPKPESEEEEQEEEPKSLVGKIFKYLSTSPVLASLVKLALMRVGVDLAFYQFHKTLHSEKYYKTFHFYHHQHNNPRLHTNYHFTIIDLIVESVLPLLFSFAISNQVFGASFSALERVLFTYYLGLFELASHSGKEYPVVTWFPPLSPLLNYFWNVDQDDVLFHTTHHMLVFCNYSISKWPDKLFGTFKLVKPDYLKQGAEGSVIM